MIKERRLSKNMTQNELAQEMGISRTTVTMWEVGSAKPTADKLLKLAQVLECTVDELLRA